MDKTVQELYGDRVRARVCGLCWKGDALLLVNHTGLYGHDFWAPPGGGIEFGSSAGSNLQREFLEETGLEVGVGEFLFACEFVKPPLHAIELFFAVAIKGGQLATGFDPEMNEEHAMITDVKFLSPEDIDKMPEMNKHGLFRGSNSLERIKGSKGYLKI